jgi:hypothetical protein
MGQEFKERAALAAELRAKAFSLKPCGSGSIPTCSLRVCTGRSWTRGCLKGRSPFRGGWHHQS